MAAGASQGLARRRADVARATAEYNALMCAGTDRSGLRYPEVVKALLDAGADVETKIFMAASLMRRRAPGTAVVQVLLGRRRQGANEAAHRLMMVKERLHRRDQCCMSGTNWSWRDACCVAYARTRCGEFLKKDKH